MKDAPFFSANKIRLFLYKFNDIADPAGERGTNAFQNKAVIPFHLIFIVIVDDLILNSRSFCKLVSADITAPQGLFQTYSYHNFTSQSIL